MRTLEGYVVAEELAFGSESVLFVMDEGGVIGEGRDRSRDQLLLVLFSSSAVVFTWICSPENLITPHFDRSSCSRSLREAFTFTFTQKLWCSEVK